jgi:hypothetical protein
MRASTRLRRFQLSMQAWFCLHWMFRIDVGPRDRNIMLQEYADLAGWRVGAFRV